MRPPKKDVAEQAAQVLLPLLYHELRPESSSYSYVLSCSRFAEHLDLFARVCSEAPEGYLPLLTFDDGHISNHAHALPMLQSASVQAHFFVTAGWTGTRAEYMEPRHLRELHAAGHTIGAHSWSHRLLTGCSDVELHRELHDARTALQDWTGAPVTALSLPGGRGNARVLRACREAGYTTVWTSAPGVTRSPEEPLIGRFNILAGITDAALEGLLDPESGALQRAARISRAKAAAQRVLGDRLYGRLWAAVNRQESGAEPGSPDAVHPEPAAPEGPAQ